MKKIYEFVVEKEQEVEKTEVSKNAEGAEVTIKTKVIEKVPHKFFIKKPSRIEFDGAELYKAEMFSEATKRGVLTHSLISKRIANDGGYLSEPEKIKYTDGWKKVIEAVKEQTELNKKTDKTPEDEAKLKELISIIETTQKDIQDLELTQLSLFENSAEAYARNKVIRWWLLTASYLVNDKGEEIPLFSGKTTEDRLASYDKIEEDEDAFLISIVNKFVNYITFWYVGSATNPEDFDKLKL